MIKTFSDVGARAANCWFNVDRVAKDSATTAWKRRARWHQSQWRAERAYPLGAHPYKGGPDCTVVGSRLELAFAKSSGANFITPSALAAAQDRVAKPEKHQLLNEDRLWADLLSSMPLCFNLFSELWDDSAKARASVVRWWPDAPEGEVAVRFEYSPGRRDAELLNNRTAFDVAFDIAATDGSRGIIGVETKYHEHTARGDRLSAEALSRYVEVTERSGVFADGWRERIVGRDLEQIWLDHLLVLAMLQHPSNQWKWGKFVLVYPSKNPSFARAAADYRATLRDGATFEARTLEDLLGTAGALDAATVAAFTTRYLF